MSQAPHYIILYYYLLLLSFITQPYLTKPILNITKHNQTQMGRTLKSKCHIEEHVPHCCFIEYCLALLWNSITKTRPAKATRPLRTGIGAKLALLWNSITFYLLCRHVLLRQPARWELVSKNFRQAQKNPAKAGHKKREPFGSLNGTCLSYFCNSFIRSFERLITLFIE